MKNSKDIRLLYHTEYLDLIFYFLNLKQTLDYMHKLYARIL